MSYWQNGPNGPEEMNDDGTPVTKGQAQATAYKQLEAEKAKHAADVEKLTHPNGYISPYAPGGYTDSKGAYAVQGSGLPGLAGALVDPNSKASAAFEWGGHAGGAQQDIDRARGLASDAAHRGFIQADYGQANQSRGSQQDALGMYRDAALGRGPSAAQGLYQQGLDRSMAANTALGNSARGGSLALAQGRLAAIGANSTMLAGSTAQAAQLRAQEQQAGMAGYAGLGSQIRGQDLNAAQANAGYALGSQGQNDALTMGYENQGYNVGAQQLGAQGNRTNALLGANGVITGAKTADAALQAQNQAHSEDNTARYVGYAAGAGGAILGAALPVFAAQHSGGGGEGSPTPYNPTPGYDGGAGGIANMAGTGAAGGGVGASSYRPNLGGGGGAPAAPPAAAPQPLGSPAPQTTRYGGLQTADRPYRRFP